MMAAFVHALELDRTAAVLAALAVGAMWTRLILDAVGGRRRG